VTRLAHLLRGRPAEAQGKQKFADKFAEMWNYSINSHPWCPYCDLMGRRKATALLAAYAGTVTVFGSVLAAVPALADGAVGSLHTPISGDQGGAVLSQINITRAANGCGPVAANQQLTASAARQADDMLENGAQGHVGSDGSSLAQRVTEAGYTSYTKLGEIVFWSTGAGGTPAAAVIWWMNSPRHRAIITDCELTDAGFSTVTNSDKITVAGDFGRK
jgi:uncharacterized protein YkwD